MKLSLAWLSGTSSAPWLSQRFGWLIDVPGDAPLDRALGRALAHLLVGLIVASVVVLPIVGAAGLDAEAIRVIGFVPATLALLWCLNRKGSRWAPGLFCVIAATLLPHIYAVHRYIDVDGLSVTHAFFLAPVMAAVFFVSTPYAIVLALYEALVLSLPAWAAGYAAGDIISFYALSLVNLVVLALMCGVIADRYRLALQQMHAMNTQLDARVVERTAELERLMRRRREETHRVEKDIRSLMTIQLPELELLQLDVAEGNISPETVARTIGYVRVAQQLQLGLMQDMHDAAVLDDPAASLDLSVRRFDLAARLREAMSLYAVYLERERVSVALELPASLWVEADSRRVERVLVNVMERVRLVRSLQAGQVCARVQLDERHGHAVIRVTYDSNENCMASAQRALAFCEVLVSRIGGSLHVASGDGCELVTIALPLDHDAVMYETAH